MPLRVLRSRLLVGGNLTMALFAMAAWGMSFTVSEYAQDVLGFSPLRFGVGTAVMTVMAVVGAYAAQAALTKVSIRTVAAGAAALSGVAPHEAGLASGTNTAAFQIGGALGTAIVSSVVAAQVAGAPSAARLTEAFRTGFATCVIFAVVGLAAALLLLVHPGRGADS
jgi:hypothetical protein